MFVSRREFFLCSFALQTKYFGQTSQIQFGPGHCSGAELKEISILPQFVLGWNNVVADYLSRPNQVIGAEWTLHQDGFDWLHMRWPVTIDLCVPSLNRRYTVYFAPVSDPMAEGTDAMLQSWDFSSGVRLSSVRMVPQVLVKLCFHSDCALLAAEGVIPGLLDLLLEPPLPLPDRWIYCVSRTFGGSTSTSLCFGFIPGDYPVLSQGLWFF